MFLNTSSVGVRIIPVSFERFLKGSRFRKLYTSSPDVYADYFVYRDYTYIILGLLDN